MRGALVVLSAVAGCLWTAPAVSDEPRAESTFSASVEGTAVSFLFRFDTGLVLRTLERGRDAAAALGPQDIEAERDRFRAYFDDRFSVSSDGVRCGRGDFITFRYNPSIERVVLTLSFGCPAEPNVLTLESTLFLDLRVRQEMIGDLRYRHALERYFFNYMEHTATIRLPSLHQADLPDPVWLRRGDAEAATRTAFRPTAPTMPTAAAAPAPGEPGSGTSFAWVLLAASGVLVALVAVASIAARRRRHG